MTRAGPGSLFRDISSNNKDLFFPAAIVAIDLSPCIAGAAAT